MTYSLGGLIQANDYNGFVGGIAANVSGQVNTLWSTGTGNAGYGQTGLSNVSVAGSVTAAQWSTLVGTVNALRSHQASFSNLSLYTTGTTINATTDVATNLSTAYTNRLNAVALGSVVTGSNFTLTLNSPNTTAAVTSTVDRTVTFSSGDAARYFFNAGGELRFVIPSFSNPGGTTRGSTIGTLAVSGLGGKTLKAQDMSARTGTGYTVNTDLTTGAGYYSLSTSVVTKAQITGQTGGAAYASDTVILQVFSNGTQGSNSDAGSIVTFRFTLTSAAQSPAFDDSIDLIVNHRIDIAPPSTTYLTDTWGTPTIA